MGIKAVEGNGEVEGKNYFDVKKRNLSAKGGLCL